MDKLRTFADQLFVEACSASLGIARAWITSLLAGAISPYWTGSAATDTRRPSGTPESVQQRHRPEYVCHTWPGGCERPFKAPKIFQPRQKEVKDLAIVDRFRKASGNADRQTGSYPGPDDKQSRGHIAVAGLITIPFPDVLEIVAGHEGDICPG